jgi:hypothetical protein
MMFDFGRTIRLTSRGISANTTGIKKWSSSNLPITMTITAHATAIPMTAPVLSWNAPPLPPDAPAEAPPDAAPTPPTIEPVPSESVIVGNDPVLADVGACVEVEDAAAAASDCQGRKTAVKARI